DNPDLQPREREAPAEGLRPRPPQERSCLTQVVQVTKSAPIVTWSRSSPSSLRAAPRGRSMRTGAIWRGLPPSSAGRPRRRRSRVEEVERYTAALRAEGLSAATIARRTASARTFFRHLQLIGARDDNPAAAVALPRRTRRLPRTLSAGEAERLIEAAKGITPR